MKLLRRLAPLALIPTLTLLGCEPIVAPFHCFTAERQSVIKDGWILIAEDQTVSGRTVRDFHVFGKKLRNPYQGRESRYTTRASINSLGDCRILL